jgi:hypothetical protein
MSRFLFFFLLSPFVIHHITSVAARLAEVRVVIAESLLRSTIDRLTRNTYWQQSPVGPLDACFTIRQSVPESPIHNSIEEDGRLHIHISSHRIAPSLSICNNGVAGKIIIP